MLALRGAEVSETGTFERAVAAWGEDPSGWPSWTCTRCNQANDGFVLVCGRCEQPRLVAPPATEHAEDRYEGEVGEGRRKMPTDRAGTTHKIEITDATDGTRYEGYVVANTHDDGTLGEVFIHGFGKEGSTLLGWTQVAALLFSIALQYQAEFPMLARKLAHMKFPPYGRTSNPRIPWCSSVPDYIVRWLALQFGTAELNAELAQIAKEVQAA